MELSDSEKAVLDKLLAGRDLIELFTPERRVTALLDELRRTPVVRATFDDDLPPRYQRAREVRAPPPPELQTSPKPSAASQELTSNLLSIVVDYANGMTQQEISRKHGIHVQTVRKRLREAGVVTRV